MAAVHGLSMSTGMVQLIAQCSMAEEEGSKTARALFAMTKADCLKQLQKAWGPVPMAVTDPKEAA